MTARIRISVIALVALMAAFVLVFSIKPAQAAPSPCPWNTGCSWQVCDYAPPVRGAGGWRTITATRYTLMRVSGYNNGSTLYPGDPANDWHFTCEEVGITQWMTFDEGVELGLAAGAVLK